MKYYHTILSFGNQLSANIIGLFVMFVIVNISCNNNSKELSPKESALVQQYLDEKIIQPTSGGKIFSSFVLLKKGRQNLYLWAYIQEYVKKEGNIIKGSGMSLPMKIHFEENGNEYKVVSHFTPGDGEQYAKDIHEHFPEDIQKRMLEFPSSTEIQNLENRSKERAELFFNKK